MNYSMVFPAFLMGCGDRMESHFFVDVYIKLIIIKHMI